MPKIIFEESPAGARKEVDAPTGGLLLDICDDHYAPVPFSCRSASCATCHIEVLEGAALLEEPEDAEKDLLDIIGAKDTGRLACQTTVKPGEGTLRVRSLDEG